MRRVGRGRIGSAVGGQGGAICEGIEGRVARLGPGDAAARVGEAEGVIVGDGELFMGSGLLLPRRHSEPTGGARDAAMAARRGGAAQRLSGRAGMGERGERSAKPACEKKKGGEEREKRRMGRRRKWSGRERLAESGCGLVEDGGERETTLTGENWRNAARIWC